MIPSQKSHSYESVPKWQRRHEIPQEEIPPHLEASLPCPHHQPNHFRCTSDDDLKIQSKGASNDRYFSTCLESNCSASNPKRNRAPWTSVRKRHFRKQTSTKVLVPRILFYSADLEMQKENVHCTVHHIRLRCLFPGKAQSLTISVRDFRFPSSMLFDSQPVRFES